MCTKISFFQDYFFKRFSCVFRVTLERMIPILLIIIYAALLL